MNENDMRMQRATGEWQFPVALTQAAVERLKRIAAKEGRAGDFLRVGVKGGGCSGLEYVLSWEAEPRPSDLQADFDGVRVVLDPKSALYLTGATLDFTGELLGGGFRFDNPNAERGCGCGASFTPKNEQAD